MVYKLCYIYYFIAGTHQLVTEYQEAPDDKKLQMEQRYGKKQLLTLVENTMSENWIKTNSQKCPKCKAAIEVLKIYLYTCLRIVNINYSIWS